MRFFLADLHIHTCLSACAELEMLPELIVAQAQELGLQLIAVTDHNSAGNVAAVLSAARGSGITVLPGMEVQTREEVHVVVLFDTLDQVNEWQTQVYAALPALENDEALFGEQLLLDADGKFAGYMERLLLTSVSWSLEELVRRVHDLGGLSIPAHVDRPAYSVIANLGFVPPELELDGVEISQLVTPAEARSRFRQLAQYSLVGNSDAHRLKDMVARTTLKMAEPTVAEIALALAGEGDRSVWVDGTCTLKH